MTTPSSGPVGGGNPYQGLISELRRTLPPEQQQELDGLLRETAAKAMQRYAEMDATVKALAVLHRPGTGERAGFCSECGNVTPCQTVRFIQPFLAPPIG